MTDHCGSCRACIDSCSTGALIPYQIDASKCISYLTIELRDEIPSGSKAKWTIGLLAVMYANVCPWNRFSQKHNEPLFNPNEELIKMKTKDWEELTEETFEVIFKNSAVKRTKFKGLKRNISFIS